MLELRIASHLAFEVFDFEVQFVDFGFGYGCCSLLLIVPLGIHFLNGEPSTVCLDGGASSS